MDCPSVGEQVIHLAAHCDGEAATTATVLSVHLGTGCACIQSSLGPPRMVPLHELQVVGISAPCWLKLDDYHRYT